MHDVVITVNTRPAWHQRTKMGFDSPELLERMQKQAWLAMRQVDGRWDVVVTARWKGRSREVTLDRPGASF